MLRVITFLIRLSVVLATIAFSFASAFVGYFAFSTGITGTQTPNPLGLTMILFAFAISGVSFFIFKKKKIFPIVFLFLGSLIELLLFIFIDKRGEFIDFFIYYFTTLLILCTLNFLLEKKLMGVSH